MGFRRAFSGLGVLAALVLSVLQLGPAMAQVPGNWVTHDHFGVSFATPPEMEVRARAADRIVISDMSGPDAFPGSLITLILRNEDSGDSDLQNAQGQGMQIVSGPQATVIGDRSMRRYDLEGQVEGESTHAVLWTADGPDAEGQFLHFSVISFGHPLADARAMADTIAASFEAGTERPGQSMELAGLDGMLSFDTPPGLDQTYDREDHFRVQSAGDYGDRAYLAATTGAATEEALATLRARMDNGDYAVTDATLLGHPALLLTTSASGAGPGLQHLQAYLLDMCLPDGGAILVRVRLRDDWIEQMGGFDEMLSGLSLTLPGGMRPCDPAIAAGLRQLGSGGGGAAPEAPAAPAPQPAPQQPESKG